MNLLIHELFVMRYREVSSLLLLKNRRPKTLTASWLTLKLAIRRQERRIAHIERLMDIQRGKLSRHRAQATYAYDFDAHNGTL